jgi:putative nucleotidyltransferase with HDIG domain
MTRNQPPSALTLQGAQRLATLLAGIIRAVTLYPPDNPALTRPLSDLATSLGELLGPAGTLQLGITDGIPFVGDQFMVTPPPAIEELTRRLSAKEIRGISFLAGVEPAEILRLAALLADRGLTGLEAASRLGQENISHIRLSIERSDEDDALLMEAHQAYDDAMTAIRSTFSDLEQLQVPDSSRLIAATKRFVGISMKDPVLLIGLAMIKDYDNYTFTHSMNVGVLAMTLATAIGYDRASIEETGIAGFLHDIGKTKVPKQILNKPGKLTTDEFAEIKKHPEHGVKIIDQMAGIPPRVSQAVLGHHIRYDRQGYPEWASKLPLNPLAHLIAVADCYDASTTLRVYQQPLTPGAALDTLQRLAGTFLDEIMVGRFVTMMGKYPVGTLVRLDNNEIAVVVKPDPTAVDKPTLKVIFNGSGERVETPYLHRLAETGERSIVALVDPVSKGINVGCYFS